MAGRAGVCVLIVWALIVIVPDFARVFTPYSKLNVQADNDGRLFTITGNTRQKTDLLIDTKCTPWSDLMAMFGGLGGLQYVRPTLDSVTLCVRNEHDPPTAPSRLTTYRAQAAPLDTVGRITLALDQVFGVLFIVCGAVLVWRLPNAVTWGFFLYAIWFNPGQNYVLYAELQRWPFIALAQEVLQAIALTFGYCGFVVFALRFPGNGIENRWRRVERALPVVALVLLILNLWSFLTIFGWKTELVAVAAYSAGVAIAVTVIVILLIRRYKIDSPADRQKTRWVFLGCLVGLSAFLFADSNATTEFWQWMWNPSEAMLNVIYLVNAALPVSVYYAITRHRVVNVTFALSRKLTRPLLWFIAGVVVVSLQSKVEHALEDYWGRFTDAPVLSYAIVISVVITTTVLLKIVIDWLHERIYDLIEGAFFRQLLNALDRMGTCEADLKTLKNDSEIDSRLVEDPVVAFALASAALFRRVGGGPFRRMLPAYGWPESTATALAASHALIDPYLARRKVTPTPVPWSQDFAKDMPQGPAYPAVAIPIFADDELIGLAVYGPHNAGDDLNEDVLKALDKFAQTAGRAYRRVAYDQMHHRIEQLEAENARLRQTLAAPAS